MTAKALTGCKDLVLINHLWKAYGSSSEDDLLSSVVDDSSSSQSRSPSILALRQRLLNAKPPKKTSKKFGARGGIGKMTGNEPNYAYSSLHRSTHGTHRASASSSVDYRPTGCFGCSNRGWLAGSCNMQDADQFARPPISSSPTPEDLHAESFVE